VDGNARTGGNEVLIGSPLAATYVLLGILLQAWFCLGRKRVEGRPQALWPQVVTGILYAAAVLIFPGDIYQS